MQKRLGLLAGEARGAASGAADEPPASGRVIIAPGSRIKIAGDGSARKVPGNLIGNNPSRLPAQLPAMIAGAYRVRVIARYASEGSLLKEPRQPAREAELPVS
ncbi:MAG: DUF4469 domain-containing protein [Treponema sp.]|nr:DUF4469 domain-containing protein [Treponema sp.]